MPFDSERFGLPCLAGKVEFRLLLLRDTRIDEAEFQGGDLFFVLVVRLRHLEEGVISLDLHAYNRLSLRMLRSLFRVRHLSRLSDLYSALSQLVSR